MNPEMEKPRVTEIKVRMDCNGCVQKIKKALHGITGIYELYVDFPQQKISIIGWTDPEKIVKAIKKTRKSAVICSLTEQSDQQAQQTSEPVPEGGTLEGGATPPESTEQLQTDAAPPDEAENEPPPSSDNPPPPPSENPSPESASAGQRWTMASLSEGSGIWRRAITSTSTRLCYSQLQHIQAITLRNRICIPTVATRIHVLQQTRQLQSGLLQWKQWRWQWQYHIDVQ